MNVKKGANPENSRMFCIVLFLFDNASSHPCFGFLFVCLLVFACKLKTGNTGQHLDCHPSGTLISAPAISQRVWDQTTDCGPLPRVPGEVGRGGGGNEGGRRGGEGLGASARDIIDLKTILRMHQHNP